jgi:hypothetical protein
MQASLLLDGVNLPNLPHKLYEWSPQPEFEPLYLGTDHEALLDLSPCLVRLTGRIDPVVGHYLEHAKEECGFLLFSQAPWQEQIQHMRWLSRVQAPHGEEMLLRLADPAVFHALMGEPDSAASISLLGPFELAAIPDALEGVWHEHRQPPGQRAPQNSPYRLCDEQLTRLGEVNFRSVIGKLDLYMQTQYPAYGSDWDRANRRTHLTDLAEDAYAKGFCSEEDIFLYANIFGLLGSKALEAHPDIAQLLEQRSTNTPAQRLHMAVEIAQGRAPTLKRKSHA